MACCTLLNCSYEVLISPRKIYVEHSYYEIHGKLNLLFKKVGETNFDIILVILTVAKPIAA